jgi:hypothetical protein
MHSTFIEINNSGLRLRRTESLGMATSVVWVINLDVGFINTTVFRCNDIQRVYTRTSYTRKPVFIPLCGDTSSGVTLCLWSHQTATVTRCGSQEWQMLRVSFLYDTVTLWNGEYCQLSSISNRAVITYCDTTHDN